MTDKLSRIYTAVVQMSILVFTCVLVWFAFVYYPKVVNNYKTGNFPKKNFVSGVAAASFKFPIETKIFRLVYEENSGTYYAFISGENLDDYLINKNSAQLAMKTALSRDSLCNVNIVYVSTANLKIPEKYKGNTDCR